MAGAMGSKVGRYAGRQEMRRHGDCPKNTGEWRESRGRGRRTRVGWSGSRQIEKHIYLASGIAALTNPAWHEGQFGTKTGGPLNEGHGRE